MSRSGRGSRTAAAEVETAKLGESRRGSRTQADRLHAEQLAAAQASKRPKRGSARRTCGCSSIPHVAAPRATCRSAATGYVASGGTATMARRPPLIALADRSTTTLSSSILLDRRCRSSAPERADFRLISRKASGCERPQSCTLELARSRTTWSQTAALCGPGSDGVTACVGVGGQALGTSDTAMAASESRENSRRTVRQPIDPPRRKPAGRRGSCARESSCLPRPNAATALCVPAACCGAGH
jgi:hypothetical protein